VALADVAEAMEEVGHPHRNGGLAGAGIAGEAHMQCRRLMLQAERAAGTVDHQQRSGLADALLDRRQADQFAIELAQHLGDAGLLELLGKVDRLLRISGWGSFGFQLGVGGAHGNLSFASATRTMDRPSGVTHPRPGV
jgi:hypothetical protein